MAAEQNHDLEPLLANQQSQLSLVFSDSDAIDTKALTILGANIAIIIFINQTSAGLALWEYLALYGPFTVSLVLNVISVWPRRYKSIGVSEVRLAQYINMPREQLLLKLLANTQAAIVHNTRLNRFRTRICLYSICLTGLGFLTLLFIL